MLSSLFLYQSEQPGSQTVNPGLKKSLFLTQSSQQQAMPYSTPYRLPPSGKKKAYSQTVKKQALPNKVSHYLSLNLNRYWYKRKRPPKIIVYGGAVANTVYSLA